MAIKHDAQASYKLLAHLLGIGLPLFLSTAVPADLVSPGSDGRVIHESFFGLNIRYGTSKSPWPWVPFGSWRVDLLKTVWLGLEPARGKWHFQTLDRAVALARQHHVDVLLTLGQTPKWAASRPNEVVPNGPGASSEPADFEDWEQYVRTVATRYKGQIKYYELWNEPRFREVDPYRAVPGFTGSAKQMVELARIAKKVLTEVDPQAKLLSPAFDAGFAGLPRVKAWFKAGGGDVTDILAYHFYLRPPERMIQLYRNLRSIMKKAGYSDMPLWNTESGYLVKNPAAPTKPQYPGTDYVYAKVLTPQQVAAYVVRSYVLMAAAGLERFYWYSWDILNMGLTRDFGKEPTAASQAYATMVRWLKGSRIFSCRSNTDQVWTCRLDRNQEKAWIVWSAGSSEAWTIPTDWNARQFENPDGIVQKITGSAITVGSRPILIQATSRPWLNSN